MNPANAKPRGVLVALVVALVATAGVAVTVTAGDPGTAEEMGAQQMTDGITFDDRTPDGGR